MEWKNLLLVPSKSQALPLAYTQSGGVQHLQENAQGTKQVHERRQKEVSVDENKLKKGMAAIFPSGDFNTDNLAEALAAAINGVE